MARYSKSCLEGKGIKLVVMQEIPGGPDAHATALAFETIHLSNYQTKHLGRMPPQQINFPCGA